MPDHGGTDEDGAKGRVLRLADGALTLSFGGAPNTAADPRVLGLAGRLREELAAGRLPGVTDVVPAFRSLTLCLDPATADRESLAARLGAMAEAPVPPTAEPRRWALPICHDADLAPDLADVCAATGLAASEVTAGHRACRFTVLALGFLPGFPYLGPLDARLALPRRATPRLRVPAGSVGIANAMCCIYPWDSPGGWNLIGRSPAPLFDPAADVPNTLEAGDSVRFVAVERPRFDDLRAAAREGALDPMAFRDREAA